MFPRPKALNSLILLPLLPFLMASGPALAGKIDFKSQVKPILEARCYKCHGEEKQKGRLRLDTLSTDLLNDRPSAETWHDVLDALQLGEMPPEEEPMITDKDRQVIVGWINQELEAVIKARKGSGGRVVLRRLNRTEYQNTMRDLLGVEHDFVANLPPEGLSEDGFRNNGATLQMSDMQLEAYLAAAREGLSKAIVTGERPKTFKHVAGQKAEANVKVTRKTKNYIKSSKQLDHKSMFSTKLIDYPEEGWVAIRVRARGKLAEGRGFPQLRATIGYRADTKYPRAHSHTIDVKSEEWQDYEFRVQMEDFPLPAKSQSKFPGLLVLIDNAYGEGRIKRLGKQPKDQNNDVKTPKVFPIIEIDTMEFEGPIFETWPPKSHSAILFDSPLKSDETAYATAVLERFMQRAFRRPVSKEETAPYAKFFGEVRESSDSFEAAIREALAMVLVSPDFLFMVEPSNEKQRKVTDWELASRLSYFLWSSMPDEHLFKLARDGKLNQPKVLQTEVTRMLADERSWGFVEEFCDQWLDVGAIDRVAVNPEYYPKFDNQLKPAMRDETLHFFAELLHQNLSALNIIDSDFAMLNEPLARHYGIEGPRGSDFEKVLLKPEYKRGGVLGHGGILLGNSTGEDSHPVKRAVWIRDRLLDDPPADPPPNVPDLDATDPDFAKLPVREQLKLHREQASCNDCHRGIDPWGIALESYGGDGLWRDKILRKEPNGNGMMEQPVVSGTTLPGGHEVAGVEDLKAYLLKEKSDRFAEAFTSKLVIFALGRSLELEDEKAIKALTANFIENDHRIAPLIQAVVASDLFHHK